MNDRFRHDPLDIDEIGIVFDPESRAERLCDDSTRRGLEPELLSGLLAGGRDELPDDESQDRERHADLYQRDRHALDRYAGDAHDRVFGMGDHLRQGEQGADQRGDRQDLIGPAGKAQEYIECGERQPVAAAPEVAELLD